MKPKKLVKTYEKQIDKLLDDKDESAMKIEKFVDSQSSNSLKSNYDASKVEDIKLEQEELNTKKGRGRPKSSNKEKKLKKVKMVKVLEH